jgi:hypothetical protein
MVLHRRTNSGAHISEDWHRFREEARRSTFSLAEFSDEDIEKYDLDDARIDGSDNPRSYTYNRKIDSLGSNGTDIRTLPDR